MKRSLPPVTYVLVASTVFGSAALATSGCDNASEPTAADRFCEAVAASAGACAEPTACEAAMTADCAALAGLFNDGFLDMGAACLNAGGGLGACLLSARDGVTRTGAHDAFAAALCDNCALGVSGCQDKLFASDDSELAIAGKIIDPLSDSLLDELRTECAGGGLTCLPSFPSCAQGVLAKRVPTNTVECLVDQLLGNGEPSTCAGGGGGESSGGGSDDS